MSISKACALIEGTFGFEALFAHFFKIVFGQGQPIACVNHFDDSCVTLRYSCKYHGWYMAKSERICKRIFNLKPPGQIHLPFIL